AHAGPEVDAQQLMRAMQFLILAPDPHEPEHVEQDVQEAVEPAAEVEEVVRDQLPRLPQHLRQARVQREVVAGEGGRRREVREEEDPAYIEHHVDRQEHTKRPWLCMIPGLNSIHGETSVFLRWSDAEAGVGLRKSQGKALR